MAQCSPVIDYASLDANMTMWYFTSKEFREGKRHFGMTIRDETLTEFWEALPHPEFWFDMEPVMRMCLMKRLFDQIEKQMIRNFLDDGVDMVPTQGRPGYYNVPAEMAITFWKSTLMEFPILPKMVLLPPTREETTEYLIQGYLDIGLGRC